MFRPISLFLGLRYTRAKKRNHFISFIALVSTLGIALGVAVLITVLSVMNGFDNEIRNRILSMVPQVTVTGWSGELTHWQSLEQDLRKESQIVGMAPFIQGQALLSANGASAFAVVEGVDSEQENQVLPIEQKMVQGSLKQLQAGKYGIVLGKDLASSLGVSVGDSVTLVVPQGSLSPAGILPRLKQFKVTGIFSVGYQYDNGYALINLADAGKLFMMGSSISGLQLRLSDLYAAPEFAQNLQNKLGVYQVYDWTVQNENFFKALKMEKTMMFLILVLIIAVAAFNMLSSLVMVVTDKQADIAILRTLGMSSQQIMRVFIVQGSVVGLIGTLSGAIGGLILASNVTRIVDYIQDWFHIQFLSANVYYIDFVPSDVNYVDVGKVCLVAILLSVVATIYPAWRAASIQPAEALRYE